MHRHRRNDPAGLSSVPTEEAASLTAEELLAMLKDEIDFLCEQYQFERIGRLDRASFNSSVVQFKIAAAQKPFDVGVLNRISPWIGLRVKQQAQASAQLPDDVPLGLEHHHLLVAAAIELAGRIKRIRGKTGRVTLRGYVEALMALLQETTGIAVMGPRDNKDGDYGPHLRGPLGEVVRVVVDRMEPGVPDSEIAFWIRRARMKYAGKRMRFRQMFPGYILRVGLRSGALKMVYHTRDGGRVEAGSN